MPATKPEDPEFNPQNPHGRRGEQTPAGHHGTYTLTNTNATNSYLKLPELYGKTLSQKKQGKKKKGKKMDVAGRNRAGLESLLFGRLRQKNLKFKSCLGKLTALGLKIKKVKRSRDGAGEMAQGLRALTVLPECCETMVCTL